MVSLRPDNVRIAAHALDKVDAIHQDVPFSTTMASAVRREIVDLARWLDLDLALPS